MEKPFFDCPTCDHEVEFYDTNEAGDGGRYRCPNCGRDTEWKVGKAISVHDLFEDMKKRFSNNG